MLSCTDTTTTFYLAFVLYFFLHDLDHFYCCTVGFKSCQESSACFDKIDTSFNTTVASFSNLFFIQSIGFGIYGVLMEGMSGESSILLSKAVMDLFTALIFAGTMGVAVSLAAVPQLVVFLLIFALSQLIVPLTTPELLNDFMGCGGILTIAAGLRVSKIRDIPIMNMLPALVFAMPFSSLWGMIF